MSKQLEINKKNYPFKMSKNEQQLNNMENQLSYILSKLVNIQKYKKYYILSI